MVIVQRHIHCFCPKKRRAWPVFTHMAPIKRFLPTKSYIFTFLIVMFLFQNFFFEHIGKQLNFLAKQSTDPFVIYWCKFRRDGAKLCPFYANSSRFTLMLSILRFYEVMVLIFVTLFACLICLTCLLKNLNAIEDHCKGPSKHDKAERCEGRRLNLNRIVNRKRKTYGQKKGHYS